MKRQTGFLISILCMCLCFNLIAGNNKGSNAANNEVINPSTPLKGEWNFNPRKVWQISEVGDELLANVRQLQVDDNGRIYLFDYKLKKFYVVNPDGTLRLSFGSAGEGPGEYRRVSSFFLVDNSIMISDDRKVIQYSLEGKFLFDTVPGLPFENVPRAFINKNRFIKIPPKPESKGYKQEREGIDIYDIENKKSTTIAEIPGEEHVVQVTASTTVVFSGGKYKPKLIVCVKDNILYFGKNDTYKITRLDLNNNSTMTFSIKDRKPLEVPQSEKDNFRRRLQGVLSKEVIDRTLKSLPDIATFFLRIDVDDNGMIYVYQTIPAADRWTAELDIFSPAGKYLYRSKISLAEQYTIRSPLEIKGGYLYVSLEDDDGEVSLAKYQIDKPPLD